MKSSDFGKFFGLFFGNFGGQKSPRFSMKRGLRNHVFTFSEVPAPAELADGGASGTKTKLPSSSVSTRAGRSCASMSISSGRPEAMSIFALVLTVPEYRKESASLWAPWLVLSCDCGDAVFQTFERAFALKDGEQIRKTGQRGRVGRGLSDVRWIDGSGETSRVPRL